MNHRAMRTTASFAEAIALLIASGSSYHKGESAAIQKSNRRHDPRSEGGLVSRLLKNELFQRLEFRVYAAPMGKPPEGGTPNQAPSVFQQPVS
jgi:hypothetical protein